ncbi:MAG TPA: aminoacyl-tRNA hydrolase [Firmicutes bacterium]|jgi:PTH1 family peptidyl-tRNA hydrolase|nr:aminoacyl-tRNA hydrolase [Bacillota bacterium]HAW71418.1 aminoacyl-tRNA hydrolase [Bacillota bacterium]HAZ23073.1 aminoacyl-tRNA hydrolase [Bacillota bacterium]HBE05187.1 aminoacyl-tRNA hydrolase [Bacillota bacterium]HBG43929.1 aminoacyl-tRNA hydrolase [Bacillota bacterium]
MEKLLLAGLGNPGTKYEYTRHNIGFQVIELLARRAGIRVNRREMQALVGQGVLRGRGIILVKPQTYMNASGEAVGPLARRYNIATDSLLAIVDDMDLPLGRIRLRVSGSSGGHNGLKSLIAHLGSEDFPRLRVGIGRPVTGAVNYVTSIFSKEEMPLWSESVQMAADAAECFIAEGILEAMNRYNGMIIGQDK